jgi:DNA-binding HxlR family transcriptional regulator
MRRAINILSEMPTEDIKALVAVGVLRRNVIREIQAVAHYRNLRAETDIKAKVACEQVAAKHGMSTATLFRVIRIYEK